MNKNRRATLCPVTGEVIREHVFEQIKDPSRRVAVVDTAPDIKTPEGYVYMYTSLAHPTRAQLFIRNECKQVLI